MSRFRRRQMLAAGVSGGGGYITFADPVVEQICATNWGDGVGITPAQAAAVTSQQFRGKFAGNTQIVSFEEFQYFTGVDTLYEDGGFYGCTNLVSLKLPSSMQGIDWQCLSCPSLSGTFIIPPSVDYIQRAALENTLSLSNLISYMATTTPLFRGNSNNGSGNGTGILYMRNASFDIPGNSANYKDILVDGNLTYSRGDSLFSSSAIETVRVRGDCTVGSSCEAMVAPGSNSGLKFLELLGQYSGIMVPNSWYWGTYRSGAIAHLGYSGVAGTPGDISASVAELTKIYVGSGESQAADQAVLNQYLADPDWAQYSSKLDLWYNYNGQYKNWPTIPTA